MLVRNLLEYPVTEKEVTDCLGDVYMREDDDDRCGDLTPMILRAVLELVEEHMPEILEKLKVKIG